MKLTKEKLMKLIEQEVKTLQEDDEEINVGDLVVVQQSGDGYDISFEKIENESEYTNKRSGYSRVKFLAKVVSVAELSEF